jgi:hypothetical protein
MQKQPSIVAKAIANVESITHHHQLVMARGGSLLSPQLSSQAKQTFAFCRNGFLQSKAAALCHLH